MTAADLMPTAAEVAELRALETLDLAAFRLHCRRVAAEQAARRPNADERRDEAWRLDNDRDEVGDE